MTTSATYPTPAQLRDSTEATLSRFSIVKEVVLDYPPCAEGSNRPCVLYVNLTNGHYFHVWYDYADQKKTFTEWSQMCAAVIACALSLPPSYFVR